MSAQSRYKGKYIKSKVLARKEKCKAALAKKRQEWRNLTLDEKRDIPNLCDGNRIVNLKVLGKNLKCSNCRNTLSLEKIVEERKRGLQSVLIIQCNNCPIKTQVDTGTYHDINKEAKFLADKRHNDVTINAVLGKDLNFNNEHNIYI